MKNINTEFNNRVAELERQGLNKKAAFKQADKDFNMRDAMDRIKLIARDHVKAKPSTVKLTLTKKDLELLDSLLNDTLDAIAYGESDNYDKLYKQVKKLMLKISKQTLK